MADNRNEVGTGTSITSANLHSWSQQLGETPEAYAGFRAYLELGPGNRNIAAAYRKLRGVGPDVKVSGYFGRWSSQWNWRQRAAEWDAHVEALAEIGGMKELQAARRQTVEQAEELQGMIQAELNALQKQIEQEPLYVNNADRTVRLANLAAALESAGRARLLALGGTARE